MSLGSWGGGGGAGGINHFSISTREVGGGGGAVLLSLLCASLAVSSFYHNTASDMHRVVSKQTHKTKATSQAVPPRHVQCSRCERQTISVTSLEEELLRSLKRTPAKSPVLCLLYTALRRHSVNM